MWFGLIVTAYIVIVIVMLLIVIGPVVLGYIFMAYIVVAYVGCALCSHGLHGDCLIVICAGMMDIAVALYVGSLKV